MNIGFDAKRLFNNFTGLGNYSRFVINSLAGYAPDNKYILFSPRISVNTETKPILSRGSVSVVTAPAWLTAVGGSSIWRSWGMTRSFTRSELDVYHGLSQELPAGIPPAIKKIVTVHDLIFIRYPELYNPVDVRIYTAKVKSACRLADNVIAISKQTADDIVRYLGVGRDKITVIYQGCHPQFRTEVQVSKIGEVRKKYGLPARYVLNVGTVEKRKNIILAVKALAHIPENERIPLVIVGRETAYKRDVMDIVTMYKLENFVRFIHQAPFADLPALYQAAQLFVYPSFFEGFGIPVVEAIESGLPVITSTGSCFTEAGGPSTAYTDPGNAEELARHMRMILDNQDLRTNMITNGKAYTAKFAPDAIAAELLKVYQG